MVTSVANSVRALLLAAGTGSRLYPLTDDWPKPLMPIRGRPLLEYWLESLRSVGIRDVLVNVHHHAEQMVRFLDRPCYQEWVSTDHETRLLGTAGTLLSKLDASSVGTELSLVPGFIEDVSLTDYLGEAPELIISNFVFEHLPDPFRSIRKLLDQMGDESVAVIGVPGVETLVRTSRFDQLSHQHCQQFTIVSLSRLIERAGGEVISYRVHPSCLGQTFVAFRKGARGPQIAVPSSKLSVHDILRSYEYFLKSLSHFSDKLSSLTSDSFVGYGAAQNFPVLQYFLEVQLPISLILDDDVMRQGRFYPHLPFAICAPESNYSGYIGILTGPDFARSLVSRMTDLQFDHIAMPLVLY